MSEPLLKVENLNVYYGMIQALKGISFEVNQGEIVSLIGANGAGKTTTLHTITGLIRPKQGSVLYKGTTASRRRAISSRKQDSQARNSTSYRRAKHLLKRTPDL